GRSRTASRKNRGSGGHHPAHDALHPANLGRVGDHPVCHHLVCRTL
ncbi:MAG: hypothetical protein AVDCRST_MAG91-483, partial [uncultured Sphingomonadaceae bacterium]